MEKISNFKKIAGSVEALAKWICMEGTDYRCGFCAHKEECDTGPGYSGDCVSGVVDWLRQSYHETVCTNCERLFHDDEELEWMCDDDGENYFGCPSCRTDAYLMDISGEKIEQ